jgi:outer membrane protein assembly factor BamB
LDSELEYLANLRRWNMKSSVVAIILSFLTVPVFGADASLPWPQFRGAGGAGIAEDQRPPVEIGPDKNVKWKVEIPSGFSSPIVVGDKLVLTAFDGGKLYTIAYNRADGQEVWRTEAPAREIEVYHKTEGSPAASTPVTDGQRIVSYFGSCGLFCYDLEGKELWNFELPTAVTAGDFGSGVSPIIVDDTVVLVRDQTQDSKIYAVSLADGSLKWERKRQSPASYCTPVVWETSAGKQIVAPGHARMIGYDLKTGDEAWFVNDVASNCCASPVIAEDNLYLASWSPGAADDSEMQMPAFNSLLESLDKNKDGALAREEAEAAFGGFFDNQDTNRDGTVTREEWDTILKFLSEGKNCAIAVKPGGSGDITNSHVLWKQTKGLPYVPSAILYQGQYVMVKDGGIVTAYDAKSGDEIYQKRAAASGTYYASPVAANGNIYFTSLDGAITVLKAGTSKPEVVAENEKLDERAAATPAIADDTLYVRTEKHLYAFAEE